MAKKKKSGLIKLMIAAAVSLSVLSIFVGLDPSPPEPVVETQVRKQVNHRGIIAKNLADFVRTNQLPEHARLRWVDGDDLEASIAYTIDPRLQEVADNLLKSYKPDYGAIFMIEANTGRVLAMSSYIKDEPSGTNLNLQATFPAASVFKVVTATAAVDKAGVTPDHTIKYNGGAYTLYKKNVMTDKVTRWTNSITLRDAFARSINTAFGRLSLEKLEPADLHDYAERYMFNQEIPTDFPVEMGVAYVPPEPSFMLTEVASGYNRTNRMSPVQGAMIAAAVVNDGKMVVPYLVDEIKNRDNEVVYKARTLESGTIMTHESAKQMRELMERTVIAGTSRRSFRPLTTDRRFRDLEMGGKTGHLTGDNPRGRTDWFVGYAFDGEQRVAIAAVTVSKKYWTVKSAHLGQFMFRKYFGAQISKNQMITSSN